MKLIPAIAIALLTALPAGYALAAPAVGNTEVSVDSGCSQVDQGIYFASTISYYSSTGVYYLTRTVVDNVGTVSSPVYVPVAESWTITPNSGNTGGSYTVNIEEFSLSGYPISGTYTGAVTSAFGGYAFSLSLNCGSTLTGNLPFAG